MRLSLLASAAIAPLVAKVSADPLHMNVDLNIEPELKDARFNIKQDEEHTVPVEKFDQVRNACEDPDFQPAIVNLSYEDHQASCYVSFVSFGS